MTVAVRQVSTPADDAAAGTSIATNSITVLDGSYLHACFTNSSSPAATLSSVTSSPTLTWTILDSPNDSGNTQRLTEAVSSVTTAGAIVVTGNFSASTSTRGAVVKEISGASGYDSAAAAHNGQTQASPTTGVGAVSSLATPTLTSQPALVSGFSMENSGTGAPAADTGAGFTSDCTGFGFGGTALMRGENKRVTSTSGAAATFTAGTNTGHNTVVAAFLENAAGPPPLTITQQPANVSVAAGAPATLTIAAQLGVGSLSYQWQDNRTGAFANTADGSGATTASYTTPNATQALQGRLYRCVVTDSNGSTTTNAASIGVVGFALYLWNTTIPAGSDVWMRDPSVGTLGATIEIVPSVTANLTAAVAMAAIVETVPSVAADIGTAIALSASSIAGVTVAADLGQSVALTANCTGTASLAANLGQTVSMSAPLAAQATITADLSTGGGASMAAVVASKVTVTATLSVSAAMAAQTVAAATVTANLSIATAMAAAVVARAQCTAALTEAIALQATAQGLGSLAAALTVQSSTWSAYITAQSRITATLAQAVALAAIVRASATASAALTVPSSAGLVTYPLAGEAQIYPLAGEAQTYPLAV